MMNVCFNGTSICAFFSTVYIVVCFFFFKQKTAYEMRISDWSSDVCSSDLFAPAIGVDRAVERDIGRLVEAEDSPGMFLDHRGAKFDRRSAFFIGQRSDVIAPIRIHLAACQPEARRHRARLRAASMDDLFAAILHV